MEKEAGVKLPGLKEEGGMLVGVRAAGEEVGMEGMAGDAFSC